MCSERGGWGGWDGIKVSRRHQICLKEGGGIHADCASTRDVRLSHWKNRLACPKKRGERVRGMPVKVVWMKNVSGFQMKERVD